MFADPALAVIAGERPGPLSGQAYRAASFSEHRDLLDPGRFYEPGYDEVLKSLVAHVIAAEAPIAEGILVQRIARAHGFQRAGRVIRDRVMEMVARHHHAVSDEAGQRFVWESPNHPVRWICFRRPASDEDVRSIEEIAFEELRAAASFARGGDKAGEIARLFGVRRVSASARKRLDIALGQRTTN